MSIIFQAICNLRSCHLSNHVFHSSFSPDLALTTLATLLLFILGAFALRTMMQGDPFVQLSSEQLSCIYFSERQRQLKGRMYIHRILGSGTKLGQVQGSGMNKIDRPEARTCQEGVCRRVYVIQHTVSDLWVSWPSKHIHSRSVLKLQLDKMTPGDVSQPFFLISQTLALEARNEMARVGRMDRHQMKARILPIKASQVIVITEFLSCSQQKTKLYT